MGCIVVHPLFLPRGRVALSSHKRLATASIASPAGKPAAPNEPANHQRHITQSNPPGLPICASSNCHAKDGMAKHAPYRATINLSGPATTTLAKAGNTRLKTRKSSFHSLCHQPSHHYHALPDMWLDQTAAASCRQIVDANY